MLTPCPQCGGPRLRSALELCARCHARARELEAAARLDQDGKARAIVADLVGHTELSMQEIAAKHGVPACQVSKLWKRRGRFL
jgi:uncharacterized protein YdbL (DUF1318 family)